MAGPAAVPVLTVPLATTPLPLTLADSLMGEVASMEGEIKCIVGAGRRRVTRKPTGFATGPLAIEPRETAGAL